MYDVNKAREILENKIAQGRVSAAALFEHAATKAPTDTVAKGKALHFTGDIGGLRLGVGEINATVHKHALGQFAQRAGVPGQYLRELATSPEAWRSQLAARILDEHYQAGASDQRFLLRSVNNEVRGFLSDRYRRLDSRPLLEAFAGECQKTGAVPVDGVVTETRMTLRALLPTVYEPVPGEVVAFGVEWGNSDYGAAAHSVRAFMLRVWCLNGATMENSLSQVHLGRGISDDVELSKKTYDLDTRTSVSAMRDIVGGLLSPRRVEHAIATVRGSAEKLVEWKHVAPALSKALLKGELASVRDSFESPDVYNLPAGNSMWRVSNAISWIAGSTADADRKLELQRLAGQVLNGQKDAALAA